MRSSLGTDKHRLDSMGISTLSGAGKEVPYMRMTDRAVRCREPIKAAELDECQVPGGVDLWTRHGFYSPGVCFVGYLPRCTQTVEPSDGWPLRDGETAVRCIPEDYECNAPDKDQRYATSVFAGSVFSAPAFEVRWRNEDLKHGTAKGPGPGASVTLPSSTVTLDALPSSTITLDEPTPSSSVEPSRTTTAATTPTRPAVATTTSISGSIAPAAGAAPLGPGYVAAVAVGTAFGVLALVLAAVLWTLRRRWKGKKARSGSGPAGDHGLAAGLELATRQHHGALAEMEHRPMGPRELPADSGGLAHSPPMSGHAVGPFEMATEPAAVDAKWAGRATS